MEHFENVDAYLTDSQQWPEEIRALRPILVSAGLNEHIKWGKPCYSHNDANIAIVQEFTDNLALMFFKGILLDDPAGVLEEVGPNSHAARRMTFTSVEDVQTNADVITVYVTEAITIENAGTEIPPRPEEELAPELAERLAENAELAEAFYELTPGRQRAYNLHVSGAKRSTTRRQRVDRIVPHIAEGKGLHDR
ncbi:YdeI/OmpD-associated family protein [Nesterenkonia ebinurensis]|uniref:YdeI/OmpD-associated family protein n=1 Tax=Nesterenkonia ebinurensis TaxID=2608252 RepID=UPI001CC3DC5B|nr:YdeI/OmpD-associated family protein [Nesterenkonia ebinurensis]